MDDSSQAERPPPALNSQLYLPPTNNALVQQSFSRSSTNLTMSRKARIPEEVRQEWNCVRAWIATRGQQPYKPAKDGYLRDALVFLEHECPRGRNPMRSLAGIAQELLFAQGVVDIDHDVGPRISAVLVVDVSALLIPRGADEPDSDVVGEESLLPQFGKRLEKPVARFLERLHLRDATIVARGTCCQLAVKLLSPTASRALTSKHVKRIVMLHPVLPPAFINAQIGSEAAAKLHNVELHIVYPNEKECRRRNVVLRSCCPNGSSVVTREHVTRENAAVVLSLLLQQRDEDEGSAQDGWIEYDPEQCDHLGQSLFVAEVRIVMDPRSKMDKQVVIDVTAELQGPEIVTSDEETGDNDAPVADLADCAQEVGALVLRGNRCVLCRSLSGEWNGMRVPSTEPDVDEMPLECAMRSVTELCDIDGPTEIEPLTQILPVNIYMPGGQPVVVTLFPFYAVNPPPDGGDVALEDADVEDEDDAYDWYTFPRAVAALMKHGDKATVAALQSLAFSLKGAARAGALPSKWGGVFGQEFADHPQVCDGPACQISPVIPVRNEE